MEEVKRACSLAARLVAFGYKQKTTLTIAVSDLICHTHVETAVSFYVYIYTNTM